MLIIDIKDFRQNPNSAVGVSEDDIAMGLESLGEQWTSPLCLRVRVKPPVKGRGAVKVERVGESDSEWRINLYIPHFPSKNHASRYADGINEIFGTGGALARIVRGRGGHIDPDIDGTVGRFVGIKMMEAQR